MYHSNHSPSPVILLEVKTCPPSSAQHVQYKIVSSVNE